MATDSLVQAMLLNSGLIQFPDAKLYNAAKLLTPEERPKVPVRLIDPDPKKYPVFRVNPQVAGFAGRQSGTISINRQSPDYREGDPRWLAGILAHEGEHMNQDAATMPESEAYARQIGVLQRLGFDNRQYLGTLERRQKEHTKKEKGGS